MSNNKHRGSDFREFLKEEGMLGEAEARALKQAMSFTVNCSRLLKGKNRISYQNRNGRSDEEDQSRAVVDRLLDASNSSVTLNTLGKAARALGRKVKKIGELVPA